MPTAEKARIIETVREYYARSRGVVFADYRGLKVKELQELRSNLRKKGAELHVVKNTLFRIAAGSDTELIPEEMHNGPTAYVFLYQNESECAKELFDFANTHKNLIVKGGLFGKQAFDAKGVEAISKLPPREQLLAQVIGAISAPLTNLVGVVEALYAEPIRTIYAAIDKLTEGAPAPEAPAAEAPAPEAPAATASAESEAPAASHTDPTAADAESPDSTPSS